VGYASIHRNNFLVAISQSVFLAAEFALRGWLGVVHQVMDRLESTQIGEHRFQVIVGHVAKHPPGHGRTQLARANIAGSYSLDEERLVVVTDAGSVRREISGGHSTDLIPACQLHSRNWLKFGVERRVAVSASSYLGQVRAVLGGCGQVRL